MEECKTLPIGDIWEEYCRRCNVPAEGWFEEIETYEKEVLVKEYKNTGECCLNDTPLYFLHPPFLKPAQKFAGRAV